MAATVQETMGERARRIRRDLHADQLALRRRAAAELCAWERESAERFERHADEGWDQQESLRRHADGYQRHLASETEADRRRSRRRLEGYRRQSRHRSSRLCDDAAEPLYQLLSEHTEDIEPTDPDAEEGWAVFGEPTADPHDLDRLYSNHWQLPSDEQASLWLHHDLLAVAGEISRLVGTCPKLAGRLSTIARELAELQAAAVGDRPWFTVWSSADVSRFSLRLKVITSHLRLLAAAARREGHHSAAGILRAIARRLVAHADMLGRSVEPSSTLAETLRSRLPPSSRRSPPDPPPWPAGFRRRGLSPPALADGALAALRMETGRPPLAA